MTPTFAEGGPLNILLLEANRVDAELITRTMKTANPGARVHRAVTHRQFTELLATRRYDLVLANYRLPNWTGMEALQEIRRLGFDTPLVLVTRQPGEELAFECVQRGAADYVLNDGELAHLPIAARRAIEEQSVHDASLRARQLVERVHRVAPRLNQKQS